MNWFSKYQFFGRLASASRISSDSYRSGNTQRFIGITLLVSCLFACHDKAALKQALIEKTVKEKVVDYHKKKIATCTKEALEEALEIVDSVMIRLALSKVDTSGRGNRPAKPLRPELNLPVDTTPIKPLFEDSIISNPDTSLPQEKPLLISSPLDTIKKG